MLSKSSLSIRAIPRKILIHTTPTRDFHDRYELTSFAVVGTLANQLRLSETQYNHRRSARTSARSILFLEFFAKLLLHFLETEHAVERQQSSRDGMRDRKQGREALHSARACYSRGRLSLSRSFSLFLTPSLSPTLMHFCLCPYMFACWANGGGVFLLLTR